ncbi:MAG: prolipoprotein diacylglyceryl transferase [bacterium]
MISLFPAREIAVDLFGWQIRWYGVLYLAAFGIVWYLLPRLAKYRDLELSKEDWLYVLTLGMAGVLVGGRLGFALLYEPGYFLAHPKEIFTLWQGGMSWHGGSVGVGLALWLASRQLKINFWKLADVAVVSAALGLAAGRLGNVINGELFAGPLAQFFAVAVNVLIFGILFWNLRISAGFRKTPLSFSLSKSKRVLILAGTKDSGYVAALFLILAGVVRFGMEYLRVQQYELIFGLTRGQLLSLIIVVTGGLLMIWRRRLEKEQK